MQCLNVTYITPSLANVLLQGGDFSRRESVGEGRVPESEGQVPGMLRHMQHHHIHTLLAALHLSYTAAVEFDRRPGLKFLIQKVAQAERAANLYRQAGASWTLRMVTLFDLTLSQVKHGLGLAEVKEVLERDVKAKNTVTEAGAGQCGAGSEKLVAENSNSASDIDSQTECHKGQEGNIQGQKEGHIGEENPKGSRPPRPTTLLPKETSQYIQMLRASFTQLCDTYLDLVIDRDGHYSAVDRMDDQPIFFLTVQPDEFPTAHRNSLEQWSKTLQESSAQLARGRRTNDKQEQEIDVAAREDGRKLGKEGGVEGQDSDTTDTTAQDVPSESSEVTTHEEEEEEVEERGTKPFSFSDLAREYSSDSEDSELPEFAEGADSGVASLAGR